MKLHVMSSHEVVTMLLYAAHACTKHVLRVCSTNVAMMGMLVGLFGSCSLIAV